MLLRFAGVMIKINPFLPSLAFYAFYFAEQAVAVFCMKRNTGLKLVN